MWNKCPTKRDWETDKHFSDSQQFHKLFFREVMDRANKRRKKGNKCVRSEKTRREKKRLQMNKCMSKRKENKKIKRKGKWRGEKAKRDEQKQKVTKKDEKNVSKEEKFIFKIQKSSFHKKDQKINNLKGICSQQCFSQMEENRNNEKRKILPKRKNCLVRFFWRKICEGEYFNTRILQHLAKNGDYNFFFLKNQQKWESKEEVSTVESTNKEFLFIQQKEYVVFPFFQRCFLEK